MRFFVLYQRQFSGMPQPPAADSHVFVDYTDADSLEEVFDQFQAEAMTEGRRCRLFLKPVCHTSMSVGDLVIDEGGSCFAVMPIGFAPVKLDTLEAQVEFALHLLALGLEDTAGWAGLFERDPAQLTAAIVRRLRNDDYGVRRYARRPYRFPPAMEDAP